VSKSSRMSKLLYRGDSHFEDMETELVFMEFAPPAAPLAIAPFLPAAKIQWLGAPIGWEGDEPHPVPARSVFVTTQGEYIVIANDGDVRNFPVGSVLLLEDTWGAGHQTSNIGDIDVVALIVSVPDPETSGS
jgi:hypothetical protein